MQDVFEHIDRNREDYLERLRRLCRQPGVAAQGEGMAEALAEASRLAEAAGGRVEHLESGGTPVMWADFGGQGTRTLNLYNHYDVQPAEPFDLWETEPFNPTIRDGKLFARGAADDKGYLVARLCAIDALRQVRGQLPLKVRMIAEGEEEIGSINLGQFVDRHEARLREADACMWEGSEKNLAGIGEIYLGVKGMIYVEFTATGPNRDLHSMWGGLVPNPAWRLVRFLNRLVDEEGRVQIPGFYDDVMDPGETARALIDSYPFEVQEELDEKGITAWQRGLSGREVARSWVFDPTSNIAGFTAGYGGKGSKTVLPASASCKMDFRLVPRQDPKKIQQSLLTWMEAEGFEDIKVEVHSQQAPSRGSADDPVVKSLLDAAPLVGLEVAVIPNNPGTGPMYDMVDRLGLPTVSGECVGRSTSLIHSPNEHIHVEDYFQAIKHVAAFLDLYARS